MINRDSNLHMTSLTIHVDKSYVEPTW